MARNTGKPNHIIEQWLAALEDKPYEFGFLQALRLLECAYADQQRFGRGAVPEQEPPVRLGQKPDMIFAPASIEAFDAGKNGTPARLLVRFFGLFGPNGPLPLHLTEYAQNRQRHHKDPTFTRFLDMFHHRLLTLFYRAWAEAEPTVHFDRPHTDRFAGYVGALAGLGMTSLRQRDAIADWTKFYFGGRLACQTKNAEGLQAMAAEYFQEPIRIQEFVGEWIWLPRSLMYRLGSAPESDTLGKAVVVGNKVWSSQHKFRITIGPLNYSSYLQFLPDQMGILHLVTLVRNYIGDELTFDVQLQLKQDEVPPVRLDGQHRLGWTTWLGPREAGDDADDLIFDAFAATQNSRL